MKRLIFLCILNIVGVVVHGQSLSSKSDSIQAALNYQIKNYPSSQYRDIYKNFMQDFYGPGHILKSKEGACDNLQKELASVEFFDGPDYEATGYQGNFYRVNLRLINDGSIPYMTYMNAFVDSVSRIIPPTAEEWNNIWKDIDTEIKEMGLSFENEAGDRVDLEKQLNEGNFMVHHSDAYNEAVNFHYRIISKENFNNIILPLLINKSNKEF